RTRASSRRRIRRGRAPDTIAAARDRTASRLTRHESAGAGELDHLRQSARLGLRDRAPERCDAIVTAPLVVLADLRTRALFDQQTLLEHALDRAVERAGLDLYRTVGARGGVLDDGVPVAIGVGEGDQDVECARWQREQCLRIVVHRLTIVTGNIVSSVKPRCASSSTHGRSKVLIARRWSIAR